MLPIALSRIEYDKLVYNCTPFNGEGFVALHFN